jgi:predicted small lipoprotein YifL
VKLRYLALSVLAACALLFAIAGCGSAGDAPDPKPDADVTPPADSIGERIFLDTRFSEYFATHMTGVNDPLGAGDPAVTNTWRSLDSRVRASCAIRLRSSRTCHLRKRSRCAGRVPDLAHRGLRRRIAQSIEGDMREWT